MGRSVDYLNHAEFVLYFPFEIDCEHSDDYAQAEWDDLVICLIDEIQSKLPSYRESDKWDGRETRVILENNLCIIGLSEYCGLCSLSVACKDGDAYWPDNKAYHEQFAKRHAKQIKGTLEQVLKDLNLTSLRKIGTFSNGESVYEKAEN